MRVLALKPGTAWKREDMSREYVDLAKLCGDPLAVLVDGAVELREGTEIVRESRPDTLILGDFKHRAANILKSLVGKSAGFMRFTTLVGQTRCAVQQTELAHLTPPSPTTPEIIRQAFASVSHKTLRQWTADNLGSTVSAK